jgi:hypothetical protein
MVRQFWARLLRGIHGEDRFLRIGSKIRR